MNRYTIYRPSGHATLNYYSIQTHIHVQECRECPSEHIQKEPSHNINNTHVSVTIHRHKGSYIKWSFIKLHLYVHVKENV